MMKKMTKRTVAAALAGCALMLSACSWAPVSHLAKKSPAAQASATNTAIIPKPRPEVEWWIPRHQGVLEQARKGDAQLIFIGDSITHGWEHEPDLWNFYFGPYHPINMGFSGDRTEHVLWRFEHGELDGIAPKAAVIMIGTNNAPENRNNTAQDIAQGVTAVVERLRVKLPRTKILLLAIFPRSDGDSALRAKIQQVNQQIAKLADNRRVYFMDIGQNFLDPNQALPREIMPDQLHPNRFGYRIWAISIKDKVAELTK